MSDEGIRPNDVSEVFDLRQLDVRRSNDLSNLEEIDPAFHVRYAP